MKKEKPITDWSQLPIILDVVLVCRTLVASEITEKFWAATPGIYIKIERLE